MPRFGLYTLLGLAAAAGLAFATWHVDVASVTAFYGIAETPASEVNFNYPIEVRGIYVRAGDRVDSGAVLLVVDRARARETLADQDFRIERLRAQQARDEQRVEASLHALATAHEDALAELARERAEVDAERDYRRRLVESVGGDDAAADYRPLDARLAELDAARARATDAYARRRADLERERELVTRPAAAEAARLAAERDFDAAQASVRFEIRAPGSGVVGAVHVKPGEHKSAFAPLVTFYEPTPNQVLSYVHEDKLLDARLGDEVSVMSLAHPDYTARGTVTGLGSRIVSVPERLRRLPEVAVYGREVIVSLPPDNPFLQQEKVELTFAADEE